MKRRAHGPAAMLLAMFLLATPAAAQAQGGVEQAKKLFEVGAQSYSAGQYDAAIQAFEQAYRLAPRSALLFSLAQAERKQYHVAKNPELVGRALAHYRQYLAEVPSGGRRTDATDAIADLEPIAARLGVEGTRASAPRESREAPTRLSVGTQTPGAQVSIDGGAPQAAPFSQVVKPGKHRVRVEAAGFFPEEQEVVAVEGSLVPVTVDLRERPARVTFAGGDGGDVYIDGRFVGTTPLPHPLELSSGEHLVAVAKTGTKGVAFPITLERAKDRVVPVRLEQTSQRLAAYVVLGTSAAALVTGAVFTGLALGAEGEASGLRDKARRENLTPDELARANDALEGRDGYRSAAGASFAVAAGLAAVGAVLYFFDRPNLAAPALDRGGTPAPPPKGDTPMMEVSVLPAVGPTGAGAAVLGRF